MYDSPGSLIGRQVDQFRLDRFLAKGAMGMVFRAFDTVLLRTVAIKLIPKTDVAGATEEELATLEEARKRLILEAKAAGRLTHPNIVTIHCYGDTPDFVYICMEYVSGRTLSQVLNQQKMLAVEEALDVFDHILQALELAGREEIVHRDIKPSNIMIGNDGRVKVMDFGIAKLPSLSLTTVGTVLGTPHYMSPEQISGQAVDIRSDIFSVGAVFYEALTGERPFTAESTAALIYKILQIDPIPPRVLNIHVPEAVGDLLQKALAKDPADRFQTPTAMLTALRVASQLCTGKAGAKNGTTVVKKELLAEATLQVKMEECSRARVQAPPQTQPELPPGPLPLEAAPLPRPVIGAGAPKPGTDEGSKAPEAQPKGEGSAKQLPPKPVLEQLPKAGAPRTLTRRIGGLAVLAGLLVAGGMALWFLYLRPVPQAPLATDVPATVATSPGQNNTTNVPPKNLVDALIEQAKSLWESDPGTAQKLLEQACAVDPNHFDATFQLARFLTFKKDFPAAVQQYQNALRINNLVPEVFFNLGYIHLTQGAIDQAIEYYEACQALSPPYLDEVLTNLAVCHWKKNNPAQARVLLKQALDLNPNNELARNYLNTIEKPTGGKRPGF